MFTRRKKSSEPYENLGGAWNESGNTAHRLPQATGNHIHRLQVTTGHRPYAQANQSQGILQYIRRGLCNAQTSVFGILQTWRKLVLVLVLVLVVVLYFKELYEKQTSWDNEQNIKFTNIIKH